MRNELILLSEQLIGLAERDSTRTLPDPERSAPGMASVLLDAIAAVVGAGRQRGEARGYTPSEMEARGDAVLRVARAVGDWRLSTRWAESFHPDNIMHVADLERQQLAGLAHELRAAVERLLSAAGPAEDAEDVATPAPAEWAALDHPAEAQQHITLDQAAAIVSRSNKTLERAINKAKGGGPAPDIEGGGGKPHEWAWPRLRPWLEARYGRRLPERFPPRRS